MPLLRQGDFPAVPTVVARNAAERCATPHFGTQRVEEELAELFPDARVLRMDQDSTSQKNAHENMLAAFARGEYDIMLGTQMVAKGLDFEKVTLVGVLGIDSLLFFGKDFGRWRTCSRW